METREAMTPEQVEEYFALMLSALFDVVKAQQAFTTLVYVAMNGKGPEKKAVGEDACALLVNLHDIEARLRLVAGGAGVDLPQPE